MLARAVSVLFKFYGDFIQTKTLTYSQSRRLWKLTHILDLCFYRRSQRKIWKSLLLHYLFFQYRPALQIAQTKGSLPKSISFESIRVLGTGKDKNHGSSLFKFVLHIMMLSAEFRSRKTILKTLA